jgi:lipopolysaccharide/colanic/teichoic acid biosynthesis glycosyltransferase
MIAVAIWIKLDSAGAVIYRQERVGRDGVPFSILKFRSMAESQSDGQPLVTAATDLRITRCGRVLRKLKIDELPQFANVLFGHMSVVGPRPEIKKFVDMYPDSDREKILSVRPGITDGAAIAFRDESEILANAEDPEKEYVDNILPKKVAMYVDYVENQSLISDIILIFRTFFGLFVGR